MSVHYKMLHADWPNNNNNLEVVADFYIVFQYKIEFDYFIS